MTAEFDLIWLRQTLQESNQPAIDHQPHPTTPAFPTFAVQVYEVVPSTNALLWQLLDQGSPAGTVAIALQQDAGRGQWGRQWSSPKGGLYLSMALAPDLPVEQGGLLTISTAWGIARALRDRGLPVQLKWLNDLVVNGRKLGGILTESRLRAGRIHQAVIGVGINWHNAVPDGGITLQTVMAQQGQNQPNEQPLTIASLEALAAIVLQGIQTGYQDWQQHGTEFLLTAYQALLTHIGKTIEINGQNGEVVGVSTTGALRVRMLSSNPADTAQEICFQPGELSLGYEGSE